MTDRERGFPANGTPYQGVYFGPPAIERALERSIDTMYGRGLNWQSPGWRPGDNSDPTRSYRGQQPALQRFAGGGITPSRDVREGLNQLLPGTNGLPGEPLAVYVLPDDPRDQLPGAR